MTGIKEWTQRKADLDEDAKREVSPLTANRRRIRTNGGGRTRSPVRIASTNRVHENDGPKAGARDFTSGGVARHDYHKA